MTAGFSWRLVAAMAGTTAVAGACLAGCGASSPTAAQPGAAGLPPGQGEISIQINTTEFDSSKQSAAIKGAIDGLTLTATGNGTGIDPAKYTDQGGWCGPLGTTGSSASGTLGGVPFTVTLTSCDSSGNPQFYGTYTGDWGGRRVDLTVGAFGGLGSPNSGEFGGDGSTPVTLKGTIGSQDVTATGEAPRDFAPQQMNRIGSITVS